MDQNIEEPQGQPELPANEAYNGHLSIMPLGEIEKKIVENNVEQNAKLEKLRKIYAENEAHINEKRSEILHMQMDLEKLDGVYREEIKLRSEVVDRVSEAQRLYEEAAEKQDIFQERLKAAQEDVEKAFAQDAQDRKVLDADASLNAEVNGANLAAATSLEDLRSLSDDKIQFDIIMNLLRSFEAEKTRLCNSLAAFTQECAVLEREKGDLDELNEILDKSRAQREAKAHQLNELDAHETQLALRVQALETSCAALDDVIKARQAELAELVGDEDKITVRIEAEEKLAEGVEGDISRMEEELAVQEEKVRCEVTALVNETEAKKMTLEEVKQDVDQMEQKYTSLKDDIAEQAQKQKVIIEMTAEAQNNLLALGEERKQMEEAAEMRLTAMESRDTEEQAARAARDAAAQQESDCLKKLVELTKTLHEVQEAHREAELKSVQLEEKKNAVVAERQHLAARFQKLETEREELETLVEKLNVTEEELATMQDPATMPDFFARIAASMVLWRQSMEQNLDDLLTLQSTKQTEWAQTLEEVEEETGRVMDEIAGVVQRITEGKAKITDLAKNIAQRSEEKNQSRQALKETQDALIEMKKVTMELNFALKTEDCLDRPPSPTEGVALLSQASIVLNSSPFNAPPALDFPIKQEKDTLNSSEPQPGSSQPARRKRKRQMFNQSDVSSTIHLDSE